MGKALPLLAAACTTAGSMLAASPSRAAASMLTEGLLLAYSWQVLRGAGMA